MAKKGLEEIKITDLNDDCLEVIVNHFNLFGLLNSVDSCVRFKFPITRSFKTKYKKDWTNEIDSVDQRRFLFYFGNDIMKLNIRGAESNSSGLEIINIVDYLRARNELQKPSLKIVNEIFFHGFFFEDATHIESYLIKLSGLHFINSSVQNPAIIERNIPSLKALTLKNFEGKNNLVRQ